MGPDCSATDQGFYYSAAIGDRTIYAFDVATQERRCVSHCQCGNSQILALLIHPQNDDLFAFTVNDIYVFNEMNEDATELRFPDLDGFYFTAPAFSSDGKYLYTSSVVRDMESGEFRRGVRAIIVSTATGKVLASCHIGRHTLNTATFGVDDNLLYYWARNQGGFPEIKAWDFVADKHAVVFRLDKTFSGVQCDYFRVDKSVCYCVVFSLPDDPTSDEPMYGSLISINEQGKQQTLKENLVNLAHSCTKVAGCNRTDQIIYYDSTDKILVLYDLKKKSLRRINLAKQYHEQSHPPEDVATMDALFSSINVGVISANAEHIFLACDPGPREHAQFFVYGIKENTFSQPFNVGKFPEGGLGGVVAFN